MNKDKLKRIEESKNTYGQLMCKVDPVRELYLDYLEQRELISEYKSLIEDIEKDRQENLNSNLSGVIVNRIRAIIY